MELAPRTGQPIYDDMNTLGSHGQIANADLATAQTVTTPLGASHLLIQVIGTNARIRLDGTAPAADAGFQIKESDGVVVLPVAGASLQVIREADGSAVEYQFVQGNL